MKILIIEDDPELAMILSAYLSKYSMDTITAEDPFIGLSLLTQHDFDLVILDLTLPGMDGLDVVTKIRESSNIPIIISSARDDVMDKVVGMERGADDYMPKPYDPRELVTRINTILRRTNAVKEPETEEEIFAVNEGRVIRFKGKMLDLTAAEFDVLSILIEHKNGSVSREQLIYDSEHIDDESSIKNIDVIISRIRNKISEIDNENTYIKPIRGVGYLLTDRI